MSIEVLDPKIVNDVNPVNSVIPASPLPPFPSTDPCPQFGIPFSDLPHAL